MKVSKREISRRVRRLKRKTSFVVKDYINIELLVLSSLYGVKRANNYMFRNRTPVPMRLYRKANLMSYKTTFVCSDFTPGYNIQAISRVNRE